MIDHKDTTLSTNDDARNEMYNHLDVVWAEQQCAGRGQRGHTWHSNVGDNLTFSVVLMPHFLPIIEQFLISEVVALSLVDTLASYGIECRIKWTNDIYAHDSKIAGVLIEHSLSGDKIARTIVGIGLNVNQISFPGDLPNPTSMASEQGKTFDRREVLERFIEILEANYSLLESGNKALIESRYNQTLYHLGEVHTYAYASGQEFKAEICGVLPTGHLRLKHTDGTMGQYAFKEVEFVLPHKQR